MAALTDHDLPSLQAQLRAWDCPPSHAAKVLRAFYDGSGRLDLEALPIGRRLRTLLETSVPLRRSHVVARRLSADGTGTVKLLVGFDGGGAVEAVLMPGHRADRAAGCVSSQIGCAMGCDFCASTRRGLERNLAAGEIVEQFLHLREAAAAAGRRFTSLVFMGMGEPMHNLDAVIAAIHRIAGPAGGALGWRQVTVSTVGIVPGIDRLAEADLNVHLAVSLHAPDDETRSRIVPAGRRYGVAEIVAAAKRFYERSGRVVTVEYCLLEGVNDSDEQARALACLLAGFRAHVNVIPYNAIGPGVSGTVYRRPTAGRVGRFVELVRGAGAVAHSRETRGGDVDAACGQLRETFA